MSSDNLDLSVNVRLPQALIVAIDARLDELRARAPGVRLTRSDAVRHLLLQALDDAPRPVASSSDEPTANAA